VPIGDLVLAATGGFDTVQKDWMPATAIRPLLFDDPGLIWLDYFGEENGFKHDSSPYEFLNFIGTKGRQFEDKWIREVASTAVLICTQDFEVRSRERVIQTIEHVCKGTPVLAKPALWWSKERIYGVPDLIVHTSWLAERFHTLIPGFEDESPAPHVTGGDRPGHYVVFDIKFTTGLDGSDKKLAFANYAAQTRIYSFMLGQLQGSMPRHAYIVARDRLFDPMPIRITSALDQPLDGDLASLRDQFLQIKSAGSKYLPWRDSIVESNLSNKDEGWTTAKELIATDKVPGRDPSLLYQVSLSIKRELNSLGFPNLDSLLAIDPVRVPLEKCKGLGPKRSKPMRAVLEANRSGKPVKPSAALLPAVRRHEFFVDFEYLTNVNVDFDKQWPTLPGNEMVFMIGVGRNTSEGWAFAPFVAAAENPQQEKEMFSEFLAFLDRETNGRTTDPSEVVLYHWTGAEVWQARRSSDRLALSVSHSLRMLPWFDLQKPFVEGPAAVPGAWAYGLKEIALALGNLDAKLAVQWPQELSEGLNAMVMGWRAYSGADPLQSNEMVLLRQYLEVDCAALSAVLKWLRA
jgi:hypothetical protein